MTTNTRFEMSSAEQAKLKQNVNTFNKGLDRQIKQSMDKDAFLQILVTQLTHQDPTEPMKDKEFVAQMAQFSSLEQMTNMSQEFARMANMINTGQAMNLLGTNVQVFDGETLVEGKVSAVTSGEQPQIQVNNKLYDYSSIEMVTE